ncbi:MAG: hypothetical protein FIA93_12785 [Deltaproteobacteria bacterium]|nr:hypothetical protein [Deltaproteobacteria bacterium]
MEKASEDKNRNGATPTRRLLGQVLVDGGFLSHRDLERALADQNRTNEMLGEVLVRMGVLDPDDIHAAVSIQSDLANLDDAVKAAGGVRQLLGELLLKAKRITPEELDHALREQRKTGEKLGEVLVRRGSLTKNELDAVLEFQQHQGGLAPGSVRFRLGEILVATGQITREQLDAVLARQKLSRKKQGELLVESGAVQPHQVARGLTLQEKLVTAALVAVLSMTNAAGAQEIPSTRSGSASGSARITVTATVPARATVKVLHQRPEVVITNADIARGYVDLPSASRIEIRNNSHAGYLLIFEGMEGPFPMFDQVLVKGLGTEIQIGPGGGWIPRPHVRGTVTMELSYRFVLAKHARPGAYAWPFAITTRPL